MDKGRHTFYVDDGVEVELSGVRGGVQVTPGRAGVIVIELSGVPRELRRLSIDRGSTARRLVLSELGYLSTGYRLDGNDRDNSDGRMAAVGSPEGSSSVVVRMEVPGGTPGFVDGCDRVTFSNVYGPVTTRLRALNLLEAYGATAMTALVGGEADLRASAVSGAVKLVASGFTASKIDSLTGHCQARLSGDAQAELRKAKLDSATINTFGRSSLTAPDAEIRDLSGGAHDESSVLISGRVGRSDLRTGSSATARINGRPVLTGMRPPGAPPFWRERPRGR